MTRLLLPSPSAAAAGVLNLTNYTLPTLSGILLLCPQTEILYKIPLGLRLHSDPEREREGGRNYVKATEARKTGSNAKLRDLCLSFRTDQHGGNAFHVQLRGARFY